MTPTKLKQLCKSLGLSDKWLSAFTDREQAFQILQTLDKSFDNQAFQASTMVGPGCAEVILIHYKSDSDLWTFQPDFKSLKLPVSCHSVMITRVKDKLEAKGINVGLVYFEPQNYKLWLDGQEDSSALRSAWASHVFKQKN